MINVENLIEHGYTRYRDHWKGADALYQRWIRNAEGTKLYTVNFYMYEHPDRDRTGWMVSARFFPSRPFDSGQSEPSFDMEIHAEEDTTIAQVEDMFAYAYEMFECRPDPHN